MIESLEEISYDTKQYIKTNEICMIYYTGQTFHAFTSETISVQKTVFNYLPKRKLICCSCWKKTCLNSWASRLKIDGMYHCLDLKTCISGSELCLWFYWTVVERYTWESCSKEIKCDSISCRPCIKPQPSFPFVFIFIKKNIWGYLHLCLECIFVWKSVKYKQKILVWIHQSDCPSEFPKSNIYRV